MRKNIEITNKENEKIYQNCINSNNFTNEELEIIKMAATLDSSNCINLILSQKFNHEQMFEIYLGYKHNLDEDKIKIYAQLKYDNNQMHEIYWAIKKGLTIEQIKICDEHFNDLQMHKIYYGFYGNKFTIEQVKLYANYNFNIEKMNEIINKYIKN